MRRAPGADSLHKSAPKLAAGDMIANMSSLELSDEQVISLVRGLDPAARYSVVDMDSKRESEFSGRELLEAGLPVSIPVAPGALVLTYGPARSR